MKIRIVKIKNADDTTGATIFDDVIDTVPVVNDEILAFECRYIVKSRAYHKHDKLWILYCLRIAG